MNEEIRILRVQTKKERGTEGMKVTVAKTEEFPRKMEGWTKEGKKEAVARVERLKRTIKRGQKKTARISRVCHQHHSSSALK